MNKALIPDSLNSDAEYTRFYHLDIPELDDTELRDELYALRPLLWGLAEGDWVRQRVRGLESELAKRQYAKGGTK